jgi:hypothetical protein
MNFISRVELYSRSVLCAIKINWMSRIYEVRVRLPDQHSHRFAPP